MMTSENTVGQITDFPKRRVPTRVLIRGDGVAARCCAHLLSRSGVAVWFEPLDRPRLPAILLSEAAQALIREVFGLEGLFDDLPRIRRRIVAWGRDASPVELDHSAVVVSEKRLLESLGPALPEAPSVTDVDWTICAARPLPAAAVEHRFGSRMASATPVELKATAEPAACWIESVEDGWLFLIANAPGSGWLLSVGSAPEELPGKSRLIREQIAQYQPATAHFPTSPRIVAPLGNPGEPGWLACGTAAMAFDPICGDGTAHAVREAILAAAVIQAAARGEDAVQLLAHYQARLTAGFSRHLAHCLPYYAPGHGGPWWEQEAGSVTQGLDWCARQLSGHTTFRYQLNGFDLESLV
jgi:hypothetical protein